MDRVIFAIRGLVGALLDSWASRVRTRMAHVDPSDVYKRLADDFRAINGILWQIVPVMATATGALWYAVATLPLTLTGQRALLVFTALVNIVMIAALIRLRIVTRHLQRQMEGLDGLSTSGPSYLTVLLLSAILFASAFGSILASFVPEMVLAPKQASVKIEASSSSMQLPK